MNKSYSVLVGLTVCILAVILISCGDDSNNIFAPADKKVSTFESIIDISTYQNFDAITEANDGNIIAAGSILNIVIDSTGVLIDTIYNYDAYIVKFDENGDTIWTTTIGELSKKESVIEIIPESAGGYMALMTINSPFNFPRNDLKFQKISENGEVVGQSLLHTDVTSPFIYDMIQTADNGYLIVGGRGGSHGPPNMFAMKVDGSGNKIWDKTFLIGRLYNVKLLTDNSLLMSGFYYDSNDSVSPNKIYILKLNTMGDSLFAAEFNIGVNSYSSDIMITDDNNFKIFGATFDGNSSSYYILNADSNGVAISAQLFYGPNIFFISDGMFISDGGAIICGSSNFPTVSGYLARINPLEGISWTNQYDFSQKNIELTCLTTISEGGYAVAGFFTDNITNNTKALVIKTDANGVVAEAG